MNFMFAVYNGQNVSEIFVVSVHCSRNSAYSPVCFTDTLLFAKSVTWCAGILDSGVKLCK